MSDRESGTQPLWYIRQQGNIKGPYPSGGVRRFILLGRMSLDDQVSQDKQSWLSASEVPEVVPRNVREALGQADADTILPSRLREDERNGSDRRKRPVNRKPQQEVRKSERRRDESGLEKRYRESRTELYQLRLGGRKLPIYSILISSILVLIAVVYGIYQGAPEGPLEPDCNAPPMAGVVWRNCIFDALSATGSNLQGADISNAKLHRGQLSAANLTTADLRYSDLSAADLSHASLRNSRLKGANLRNSDLSFADLSGTDLSFADLRGAIIGGAELQGALLDSALWIDGRTCAQRSLGECRSE